jgi:hypothetical protein
MSQWGKRDNIPMVGTLTANLGSYTITASSPNFVQANVRAGDSIMIANVGYKVAGINSSNTITLDAPYESANAADLVYYIQQDPKDLKTHGWGSNAMTGANTVNTRNVYGIDRLEAANTQNKAKGIGHTGWVHYNTYGTTQGATRNKSEVLVAMSKNFNANVSGNLYADAIDNSIAVLGGGDAE